MSTIRRLIHSRRLGAVRVGGDLRVTVAHLRDYFITWELPATERPPEPETAELSPEQYEQIDDILRERISNAKKNRPHVAARGRPEAGPGPNRRKRPGRPSLTLANEAAEVAS